MMVFFFVYLVKKLSYGDKFSIFKEASASSQAFNILLFVYVD